jgi:peptidoglycan/xylan/chitin deacetylase (PgdA/CDA1 family)
MRKNPHVPLEIQPYLAIDDFRKTLAWIKSRFSFLTPDEFLISNKSGVLLTFDDGLANNYANVLPVLAEFKAPAVFFVSTQHVIHPKDWLPASREAARKHWGCEELVSVGVAADFYDGMSHEQLALCARNPLITIGSHTVSHPFLTHCDSARLTFELVESRRFLQEVTRQTVDLFAYPAGDYDRTVAEAVRASGYRAAFAEDIRNVGFPAFEIPRIGFYAADPAYLSLKLSGLHRQPIRGTPGAR